MRQRFRRTRDALSKRQREQRSARVGKLLTLCPAYRSARCVMFYVTHGSEVCTLAMMTQAWKDKKDVVVPLIDKKRDRIVAMKITSIDGDLEKGTYGVREPKKGCRRVKPAVIDMVLVPGLVFSRTGHRVGYGKGYYDRWLAGIQPAKRCGVCYDFQLVEHLPKDAHDEPVEMIITEKRVMRVAKDALLSRQNVSCVQPRDDKMKGVVR